MTKTKVINDLRPTAADTQAMTDLVTLQRLVNQEPGPLVVNALEDGTYGVGIYGDDWWLFVGTVDEVAAWIPGTGQPILLAIWNTVAKLKGVQVRTPKGAA